MKRKMAVLAIIGLILLAGIGIAHAEERISGTVTSVHFSPGVSLQGSTIIVKFSDGRTKMFAYSDSINEIRVNQFNIIYYEGDRITGVDDLASGHYLRYYRIYLIQINACVVGNERRRK